MNFGTKIQIWFFIDRKRMNFGIKIQTWFFIGRIEWKNVSCDGFSCRFKILNRNLTLDLCMFIDQHIKS